MILKIINKVTVPEIDMKSLDIISKTDKLIELNIGYVASESADNNAIKFPKSLTSLKLECFVCLYLDKSQTFTSLQALKLEIRNVSHRNFHAILVALKLKHAVTVLKTAFTKFIANMKNKNQKYRLRYV